MQGMVTSIATLNRADKISYIRNVMAPPAAHLTNTIDDTLVLLSKRFLIYAYLATVRLPPKHLLRDEDASARECRDADGRR